MTSLPATLKLKKEAENKLSQADANDLLQRFETAINQAMAERAAGKRPRDDSSTTGDHQEAAHSSRVSAASAAAAAAASSSAMDVSMDLDGSEQAPEHPASPAGEAKDEPNDQPPPKKTKKSHTQRIIHEQKTLSKLLVKKLESLNQKLATLTARQYDVQMRGCQPLVEDGLVGLGQIYQGLGVAKAPKLALYKLLYSPAEPSSGHDPRASELAAWDIIAKHQAAGLVAREGGPREEARRGSVHLPWCHGRALV